MEGQTPSPAPEQPHAPETQNHEPEGKGSMVRAVVWLIIIVILAAGAYQWYQSRNTDDSENAEASVAPAETGATTTPEQN